MPKAILVTGGAGFIGSHTCVELIQAGFEPVVVDDLSNSSAEALRRVGVITGTTPAFYQGSILDQGVLERIFEEHQIGAAIHFAGFKAVGESVRKPWEYYWNNLVGSLVLTDVMRRHGCFSLVFSSSATVYGETGQPLTESCPKGNPTNPYGQTKSMLEQIFTDLSVGDNRWNVVLLRYFNPIGAHESGLIGEDPKGIPNNLVPYIAQVACGKLERLGVFGDDYDTPDGTGVRDYIHVMDLAAGHVKALQWMRGRTGTEVFNLGCGRGYSVLEVLHAFERACGHKIPYQVLPRRAGDLDSVVAVVDKVREVLGWHAERDIDQMCVDSWRWQSRNPDGYRTTGA